VIGHRGASGYHPEHTLASYKLAIQLGADYIEPDLVHEGRRARGSSRERDQRHDRRRRPLRVRGTAYDEDDRRRVSHGLLHRGFTLAELKTLRAVERLPDVRPDNTRYDGRFRVPTFDQVLTLVKRQSVREGHRIGVYPETKHPTYFRSIRLPLERRMVGTCARQSSLAREARCSSSRSRPATCDGSTA